MTAAEGEGSGLIRVCRLAEGGMARVDLAIKRVGTFRRMYAVKRLHPHLASDPEFRAMFLDEARIAGLIRHPNVVGVLDVGEDLQGPFLVMDYVDGLPLGNLLGRVRASAEPMPIQVALRIALDVARGLHAAHELSLDGRAIGVVHRDLSPQNVMVGFDGQARLTDFGIAKALGRSSTKTVTGVVKGKTAYLAPEQIRLEEPDRRSDLFSLGVVIFEMLSGERLYKRADAGANMRAIVEEPVPDVGELRGDVPDELVRLLFELLAKSREARPPHAGEVANRLESILAARIQEEDAVSVAEYVELVASEAKQEQARVLAEAMEEAERTEIRTPSRGSGTPIPPAPPSKALRSRALIASVVLAAIGVVWLLARGPAPEAPLSAAAENVLPAVSVPPSAASPTPAPASPTPEVTQAAAAPSEAPSLAQSPAATPNTTKPPRRRAPAARAKNKPEPSKSAIPDWVEFGK